MTEAPAGPLHAFLAGVGRDGRGRLAADVLSFSDAELEAVHDYIQWLFPLTTLSAAQPHSPVLTPAEIAVIRSDPRSIATLNVAAERMLRFYQSTRWWLTPHDHNHLRITRILHSLRLLVGQAEARAFHKAILDLHEAGGAPVNARSMRYWAEAAGDVTL
ncbi:opioid growth factor receptor-related protein [Microvirga sp. CF3062]|uniref:opioid growth factor receptor-related protein n=1 Tax=Microvirga sp. CF3062 TaxID=3110182 RepID=UPI002E7727E7|nr:opioid growth factor receptor-related protein [Microvirga sp. CF3062]MEE1656267.1 opioid growth factor receptor-related protein [Microvirga sp. CF3062]